MKRKTKTKFYVQWHSKLAWLGGIALLTFAFSGLLHPIMIWTGPQASAFFPPQATLLPSQIASVSGTLENHQIESAKIVKVIASKEGPLLQVTPPGIDTGLKPRRYFNLDSQEELIDYEQDHAAWLGQYYTGRPPEQIKSIELKTQFDEEYPWVNRLLPVYRIAYQGEDNLVAFVYTETNALASLSNDWKKSIQALFGVLHTWSWLDGNDNARIILMAAILLCVIGLASTGTALVFALKNRKIPNKNRRWHRKLAAYLLWLPLLGFSISGLYHLLQSGYGDNYRGLKLGEDLTLGSNYLSSDGKWLERYESIAFNGMSIVQSQDGKSMFRLSLPQGRPGQAITLNKRFDGTPIEKGAIFIDPSNGKETDYSDYNHAKALVKRYFDVSDEKIINDKLITRFGMHYDFRNKRLPVWMFKLDTEEGDRVFIDPVSGVLVDRLVNTQRYEGYSFSFLHKWNFLRPLVGREARDVLMVAIMIATIGFGFLGVRLKLKKRKNTSTSKAADESEAHLSAPELG